MKNNIAKNVTRQIVINLFNDYIKSLDNKKERICIASLPGKSFGFEMAAANTCVIHDLKNVEMNCYEKNYNIYDDGTLLRNAGILASSNKQDNIEILKNTITLYYLNDDINHPSDDLPYGGPNFFWLDYCGCPKNGNMAYLKDVDYKELDPSVFVFTYEIAMRQGCDPEIQKHIDSGMSKAEAVIKYIKDTIKDTDFELLFKIEYVSSHAPMMLIAISNVKELKNNKYDYSHIEKVKKVKGVRKQKQIKVTNDKSQVELIYNAIKIGTSDDSIMRAYNISKRTLSAHKAWITMGK